MYKMSGPWSSCLLTTLEPTAQLDLISNFVSLTRLVHIS